MSSPLDVESFAKALNSERGLILGPSAEGFVRKTDDPAVFEFSPRCNTWVKVPLKMIDKVQPLGKRQCLDHLHDYVILYFKQPDSPEAVVFAELLQHAGTVQALTTLRRLALERLKRQAPEPREAPGSHYGGQDCGGGTLYDVWYESDGAGGTTFYYVPVGSC